MLHSEPLAAGRNGTRDGSDQDALKRRGLSRRVVASVPMFLAAFVAVTESDLVATVPVRLARKHAAAFGLRAFPPPVPVPGFTVSAIRHARVRSDRGLDWLVERIRRLADAEREPTP